MPRAATCPDLSQYQRLAADQLADIEKESLLEHLEGCDVCAARLNALPEQDTLVGLIRQGQTLGEDDSRETLARLVERLGKLRPGDNAVGARPNPPPTEPAPLIFACPACGKALKVKGELAGKKVQCPLCKQVVCAAAKSAGALQRAAVSGVSAAAASMAPGPQSLTGGGARVRTNAAGKPANTVDYQLAGAEDKKLYDFLASPQAPDELGRLGPYRVLQVLGAGGMGVVFRAEDPQLARLVALKAMLPALAASASARQRFLREARAAAAIKHDHIVTIYQVGEDRGVPFLAMDFLEGEPLDARLERAGKLPVAEVLRIGREMALGLAAAHQRGLIHRDIKPANIWLETPGKPGASVTGGRVKILDFGLARAVGEEAQLTQQGAIVGTPAYMAPEQAQGKSIDHRFDLFSLGCVLYRLATGEPPFRGTDVISTLMAVSTVNPRPPHELDAALPRALSELILHLVAKEAGDRPASAQAVAEALERIATTGVASQLAAPLKPPAWLGSPDLQAKPLLRKKWPILVGVAACLLLGLAGLWAAGVLKLKTQDGTIVVENLPTDAEVFVDGKKVEIKLTGDDKPIEIQVAPGKRKLEIKTAGFKMETQEVTLTSGERRPIDVRLEPLTAASVQLVDAAWLKEVAALPAAQQVQAVAAKLKDLNPGFDRQVSPVMEDGVVTELHIDSANVKDVSPLRAWPGLHWLECQANGSLADLSPLKDLKLTRLNCCWTQVSDLSPLKDMKLTYLSCGMTNVSDLSPLKDMKLTSLDCEHTAVSDLSPLKDMKLTSLDCSCTPVSDLSPLKDMKLTELWCFGTRVSDLTPLKDMKLTKFRCQEAQVTGADLAPLQGMSSLRYLEIGGPKITDAALEHLEKLTDLEVLTLGNSKLIGAGLVHLKGMTKLQILVLNNTEVTDEELIHLKGLLGLRELSLEHTRVTDAGLEQLAALKNLAKLGLNGTAVTDQGVAKLKAALPNCNIIADVKVPAFESAATPIVVPPPLPSAALEALRRDQIAAEALKQAGDGDPNKAPACLVGVLGEVHPFHTDAVLSLAYSPDGSWLASGSADKTIMLRETATGRVKRILQGHTGAVSAVGFSKDGRTLVSAGADGTLRLWPVDKEEKPTIVEAKLGQPEIQAMAVSPDGRFVAAGADSGLIKIWKWGAWEKSTEFPDLIGKVHLRSLAFSPDGELLACGGEEEKESRVRIYATADGARKGSMPLTAKGILALSFSHDGKHIAAVAHEGNGQVWEVVSGKQVAVLVREAMGGEWPNSFCVAWSPDDKTLAVGEYMKLAVYDFPTGTKRTGRFEFTRGEGRGYESEPIRAVAFSPRGEMLAAAGPYGDVPVWDTTNWKLQYLERGHRHSVQSVAVSPDGAELLSIGDGAALLRWPLARPREPVVRPLDFRQAAPPFSACLVDPAVAYSHDGRTSVITWHSGMAVRNTVADTETVISAAPVFLQNRAVSPDGKIVAASGGDGYLHLWDLALGKDVHRFAIKGRWCGLAFSRDGKFLASCDEETKRETIWNVATGAEGCSWEVKSVSRASAFSPEGQIVATGHDDGSILIWDAATGRMERALAGHSAPIRSLKFTPDGKTLVSSGNDGVIRLWNPNNVRAREVIPLGPANRPLTFDLDPSGKYLFAGGQSPVIFVLRLPTDGNQAPP